MYSYPPDRHSLNIDTREISSERSEFPKQHGKFCGNEVRLLAIASVVLAVFDSEFSWGKAGDLWSMVLFVDQDSPTEGDHDRPVLVEAGGPDFDDTDVGTRPRLPFL